MVIVYTVLAIVSILYCMFNKKVEVKTKGTVIAVFVVIALLLWVF